MTVEDASTVAAPPVGAALEESRTMPVDEALARWLAAAVDLAKARVRAGRVDGQVIGTGHADFTKGNTTYTLRHEGREFQLT